MWEGPRRDARRSTLLLVDFQIETDVFAALKTGDRAGGRLRIFFFSMDFVVRVWIEAAESVLTGIVRIGAAHHVGARVFQKNNALGDGIVGLVPHRSVHGGELGFWLGVLPNCGGPGPPQNRRQKK